MPYVLDTNIVTAWQHKHPPVVTRVKTVPGSDLFVTVVSFEEQCAGRLSILNKRLTTAQRIEAYQRLYETLDFYNAVNVLPYDDEAARTEDYLLSISRRMGTKDRRIAAIALTANATLVTHNTVHFTSVPKLVLDDWMVP